MKSVLKWLFAVVTVSASSPAFSADYKTLEPQVRAELVSITNNLENKEAYVAIGMEWYRLCNTVNPRNYCGSAIYLGNEWPALHNTDPKIVANILLKQMVGYDDADDIVSGSGRTDILQLARKNVLVKSLRNCTSCSVF